MSRSKKEWIQGAINSEHKGALRKNLGVPEGKKIPERKLEKAERSKDPIIKKRAILADTLRNFKRK
jgi:hypothetical protein